MLLRHCPMCGGVVSRRSTKDDFLAALSRDEIRRLDALTSDFHTIQDVERALGTPDTEETVPVQEDFGLVQPGTGEKETRSIRVLTYARLSEQANVQFILYSNNQIDKAIYPKLTGVPSPGGRTATKRPTSLKRKR